MIEPTVLESRQERALLVSVDTGDFDAAASLQELHELTRSAGAEPVFSVTQKREKPDVATCIGTGRLEEIREFCRNHEIDLLVFDCELSPIQIRNLEAETDVRVVDRTMLILDIFASRARTAEGKLQVELAQLQYMLPRLTGKGVALSRLGGGIGTRGPGETKLETDRRHIRRRIESLRQQLARLEQHRDQLRRRRKKDGVLTVALVGYTNAGKSTLMNALTQAGVLAENKLFATLDPTSRALKLPEGTTVMLIDTCLLYTSLCAWGAVHVRVRPVLFQRRPGRAQREPGPLRPALPPALCRLGRYRARFKPERLLCGVFAGGTPKDRRVLREN